MKTHAPEGLYLEFRKHMSRDEVDAFKTNWNRLSREARDVDVLILPNNHHGRQAKGQSVSDSIWLELSPGVSVEVSRQDAMLMNGEAFTALYRRHRPGTGWAEAREWAAKQLEQRAMAGAKNMNPTRQRFRTFMFPGRKILPGKPRWAQALLSAAVWTLIAGGTTQWLFGWPL